MNKAKVNDTELCQVQASAEIVEGQNDLSWLIIFYWHGERSVIFHHKLKTRCSLEWLLLLNVFLRHWIFPTFHVGHTIEQYFALGHLNSNLLSRFRFQIFLTHTKKEIVIDLNRIRSTNPYRTLKPLLINWFAFILKADIPLNDKEELICWKGKTASLNIIRNWLEDYGQRTIPVLVEYSVSKQLGIRSLPLKLPLQYSHRFKPA